MKKSITKLLSLTKLTFTFSVVMMSLLIIAGNCDKKDPVAGNNDDTPKTISDPTTTKRLKLELGSNITYVSSEADRLANIKDNTVYINAKLLTKYAPSSSNAFTALSKKADVERSFVDIDNGGHYKNIFRVVYPGDYSKPGLVFVNHTKVTSGKIALKAAMADCDNGSETADNTLAQSAEGGNCREYNTAKDQLFSHSYLGTVFDNTDTKTYARGAIRCTQRLYYLPPKPPSSSSSTYTRTPISSDTIFNRINDSMCTVGVVNTDLGGTVKIDDNWADVNAGSTIEVELYAIGIDISGKKVSEIATDLGFTFSAGDGLTHFNKAWDNTAIRKLLEKYEWADLKFKVKIVTSAEFTTLFSNP